MVFERMRIQDIHAVLHFNTDLKRWRAANRRNHIMGIMINGAARHDLGYQEFVLSGNCIFFFNQRDDYDVEVYEKGESFSVHFTTQEEIDTDSFCIAAANTGELYSLLHKAEIAKAENNDLKLLAVVYRICAEIERIREKEYFSRDTRMVSAKNYMDSHFREPDCLSAAIAQSGLSARRFRDLFKSNFDSTPNRYITMQKIEYAKSVLETKSVTVTRTAEMCGFSDVYYFSKVFKQMCGISPGEWK